MAVLVTYFLAILAIALLVSLDRRHKEGHGWGDSRVGRAMTRWGITPMGLAVLIVALLFAFYAMGRGLGHLFWEEQGDQVEAARYSPSSRTDVGAYHTKGMNRALRAS